jgi:hypothetical protein
LVSVEAPWVVLLTERWCVSFPSINKSKILAEFLKNVNPEYLVLAPIVHNTQRYFFPIIEANPDVFREEFRSGDARVLLIDKTKLMSLN